MALDRDMGITWYGHSAFEIRTPGGVVMIFDPWFGNPKSPKPANAVDRCDILLLTHGHYDHFGDAQTIASRLRPFRSPYSSVLASRTDLMTANRKTSF